MAPEGSDRVATDRILFLLQGLDILPSPPSLLARILSALENGADAGQLSGLAETDAAITAGLLRSAGRRGLIGSPQDWSVQRLLEHLGHFEIRRIALACEPFHQGDQDQAGRLIWLHNAATAWCAGRIAACLPLGINRQAAYVAGLLSNLGQLAILQAMPKSMARVLRESQARNIDIRQVELEFMGLDHTSIGRLIAEKWQIPEAINEVIWLHHVQGQRLADYGYNTKLVMTVELADAMVRQSGVGVTSGAIPDTAFLAEALDVPSGQIDRIIGELPGRIGGIVASAGLDNPRSEALYHRCVRKTAAGLAEQQIRLSTENQMLKPAASTAEFAADFIPSAAACGLPAAAAEIFAGHLRDLYGIGRICIYLQAEASQRPVEGIIVDAEGSRLFSAGLPGEVPPLPPQPPQSRFSIFHAAEQLHWLASRHGIHFEPHTTAAVPIQASGRMIGMVIFDSPTGQPDPKLAEGLDAAILIGGSVLRIVCLKWRLQMLADTLLRPSQSAVTPPEAQAHPSPPDASVQLAEALTEIAAGAAHELNNPLSVISGRAQMLRETEPDPERSRILEQIAGNTGEIASIVDSLMAYAEPNPPKPSSSPLSVMIEEAIHLAARHIDFAPSQVKVNIEPADLKASADSAQLASAIAAVIANAIEFRRDKDSEVSVSGRAKLNDDSVLIDIVDRGCGMDAETLRCATIPFYSHRPAGRKRGMGLSIAKRLIDVNGGSLHMDSSPGQGTRVTITLPLG